VFEVRPSSNPEEYGLAVYGIGQYVGAPPTEEQIGRFKQVLPIEGMHAAFEDGTIVGGAGAFPFELSVPGGVLPCAGVSVVGVYPTHRRRGVLRALMDVQLQDVHERGEPLAALWASEETIYDRFGYGLASWAGEVRLARVWNSYARPFERRGTTRFVAADEAATLFPPVWDALMRERPGWIAKRGAEGLLCAAAPDGTGYAFKVADGKLPRAVVLVDQFHCHLGTGRLRA